MALRSLPPPTAPPAAMPPIAAEPELRAMSILVVDDEPANVALLQYMLAAAGFTRVSATTDSRAARELSRTAQPDLILLDLMMPHFSGFDILQFLRAQSGTDLPPVLVLTADVSTETKLRALSAGAADYLTKPFDHVEVLLRIRHLLKIENQRQQLTRQNDALEEGVRARTSELSSALSKLKETVAQLQTTQLQVIRHERLSALGAMAAGLAHDFNNSLSLILGYSELLLDDLAVIAPTHSTAEFLHTIIASAQDAAGMFARLRSFYRPPDQTQPRREVDINRLVEQALAVTRPRWCSQALSDAVNITAEVSLAPDLPRLLADGPELTEMLTNLIFNAVDAMPRGGTIHLRTRLETAEGAGERIVIEVADGGEGMSEEVRARCLEPFFTTKGEHGTGLGLAMVYGAVQRHKGLIDVQSAPGAGTCFSLSFPLEQDLSAAHVDPSAVEADHSWRILAVDDQPAFIAIVRQHLSHDSHVLATAASGEEALAKFRTHPFDLVISDQAMPGMTGLELAAQVKALSPDTRVLLLTGFPDWHASSDAEITAVDLVLSKPITRLALLTSIQRVMHSTPPLAVASKR